MTELSFNPEEKNRLFRLNMQILADAFSEHDQNVTFYSQNDRPCLEGIRHYKKGKNCIPGMFTCFKVRMWIRRSSLTGMLILSLWDVLISPVSIQAVLS